jgi:hypothetical protein
MLVVLQSRVLATTPLAYTTSIHSCHPAIAVRYYEGVLVHRTTLSQEVDVDAAKRLDAAPRNGLLRRP